MILGFQKRKQTKISSINNQDTLHHRDLKLEACFSKKVKVISGCQKTSGYYVFIEKISINIFKAYKIDSLQISGKSIHFNKSRHFCVYYCIVSLKKNFEADKERHLFNFR